MIKGQIKIQVRIPRYYTTTLTPPAQNSGLYRRVVTAHMIHVDCRKPRCKCRCQMVRLNEGHTS